MLFRFVGCGTVNTEQHIHERGCPILCRRSSIGHILIFGFAFNDRDIVWLLMFVAVACEPRVGVPVWDHGALFDRLS